MPRPRAEIDTRKLAQAFAADGLHGTSTPALAYALAVAKPTLYARGRSKDALFLRAVESEVERVLEGLYAADARTAGQSARDRATTAALALLTHARRRPSGARLLNRTVTHASSSVAGGVEATMRRIPDYLESCLRRDLRADGLDPGMAPWMARSIHGAVAAIGEVRPSERRPGRSELAALAASIVPTAALEDEEGYWSAV